MICSEKLEWKLMVGDYPVNQAVSSGTSQSSSRLSGKAACTTGRGSLISLVVALFFHLSLSLSLSAAALAGRPASRTVQCAVPAEHDRRPHRQGREVSREKMRGSSAAVRGTCLHEFLHKTSITGLGESRNKLFFCF